MTKSQENFKIPKGSRLSSEPYFPIDLLPPSLSTAAKNIANSTNTPVEVAGTACSVATGVAAGKLVELKTGGFINYPQFYAVVVGRSGDGKSEPGKAAFRELERLDAESYSKYKLRLAECENDPRGAPRPIWEDQRLVNDTTHEALGNHPNLSKRGIAKIHDELSEDFGNVGRYTKDTGEMPQRLALYDNSTIVINRKGEGPKLIERPFLSIYGTIQPSIFKNVLDKSQSDKSGYTQRFLIVYPEFPKRRYKSTTSPDLREYNEMIRAVANIDDKITLTLSKDAERAYGDFYNEMEDHREHSDDFWSAVYSKAQIQVLRLSIVVKIARDYKKMTALFDGQKHYVEHDDMICATEMMRYYISCVAKFKDSEKEEGPKRSDVIKSVLKEVPDVSPTKLGEIFNVSKQYINKLKNQI